MGNRSIRPPSSSQGVIIKMAWSGSVASPGPPSPRAVDGVHVALLVMERIRERMAQHYVRVVENGPGMRLAG